MKAPGPQCLQTPVSTMRQRSMTCCPVSRPAGLSRADTAPLRAARTTVPAQSMQRVGAMATGQEDPETKHLCRRLETCHCVCRGREESGEPPCVKHLSMKSLLWLQQSPHLNFTCITRWADAPPILILNLLWLDMSTNKTSCFRLNGWLLRGTEKHTDRWGRFVNR